MRHLQCQGALGNGISSSVPLSSTMFFTKVDMHATFRVLAGHCDCNF